MTLTTHDSETILVRRHGNPDGPRILFSHGNGLASDLYYPLWSRLIGQFDLFIYDIRNHGRNPVGQRLGHNIPYFVRDSGLIVESIRDQFVPKPLIGVFHFVSAVVSLLHQQQAGGFASLVLFDPPVCHPGRSADYVFNACEDMAIRTRNSRVNFARRSDFAESVRETQAFWLVLPEVPDLLALTTLRPNGSGYELCCPPEYEAQIFEYLFAWPPETFDVEDCVVKVIGSDPSMPFSFMPAMDLSTLVQVNYDFVPDTTHFLPLEDPEACIGLMLPFLHQNGLLQQLT